MTAALRSSPLRLAIDRIKPHEARLHARDALAGWHVAKSDIDSVELVVSELVTNALRHGGSSGAEDVRLSMRLDESEVLVEVFDTSPLMPRLIATSEWDESGRGLQLVEALCEEWDAIPVVRDGRVIGKTVRARIPVRIVADAGAGT